MKKSIIQIIILKICEEGKEDIVMELGLICKVPVSSKDAKQ